MFTVAFWKDTTERVVRAAAAAFIPVVGGEAFFWNLGLAGLIGIPACAAALELAVALASIKAGQEGTASMTHPPD